jgi:hypothetical protein
MFRTRLNYANEDYMEAQMSDPTLQRVAIGVSPMPSGST